MSIGGISTFMVFNALLIWPIVYRVLVKHLDNLLKEKETYFLEEGVTGWSVVYRAIQYSSLIVFPKKMKQQYYQLTYGDFDFRANITRWQMFVAFYFYFSISLLVVLVFIVGIHDLVLFRNDRWLT